MSEQPRLDTRGVPPVDWFDPGLATYPGEPRSVRSGWHAFAGVLTMMMGAFNAVEGLAGVLTDDFYVIDPESVPAFDLTTWGWIHLVLGGFVALTGIVLLTGALWARVATVVFVVLNAVAQLAFVAVYPWWSLIVIALCVVVLWAVIVHGADVTDGRR